MGDTFPVGCAFSARIVYPELFDENPDRQVPAYQSPLGIYTEGCGLEAVQMSWGHDEYLYHVVRDRLPEEALYMIRYHSFYAAHPDGDYAHLMNDKGRRMMEWVRAFNRYDLVLQEPHPARSRDARAVLPRARPGVLPRASVVVARTGPR